MDLKSRIIITVGRFVSKLEKCKQAYLFYKNNREINNMGGIVSSDCIIKYPANITLGKNSYINGGYIFASENSKIIIGENCLISYNVHIRCDVHNYKKRNLMISKQGHSESNIIIEDDVWIGFGAQIMAGVTVGKGAVIGAGAILTKDAEPYGVYVGIPAKKINERI